MSQQIYLISLLLISSLTITQGQTQPAPLLICAQNASVEQGACICNPGYWGTNANQGGLCTQCTSNTWSTPGPSNTGASITAISACQSCALGYYVQTAGTNQASPTCSQCGNNSSPDKPQIGTTVQNVSSCNSCLPGFYMTQLANTNQASLASAQCSICGNNNSGTTPSAPPQTVGDISQCNACQPGFFMTAAANTNAGSKAAAACSACPASSTSKQQITVGDISVCMCFDPNALPLSSSQKSCICKISSETPISAPGGTNGCSPDISFAKIVSITFGMIISLFILL